MSSIFNYFIEANLCLLLLGMFYHLFLRREKHFSFSRFTILTIVAAALIVPLLTFASPFSEGYTIFPGDNYLELIPQELITPATTAAGTSQDFTGSPAFFAGCAYVIIMLILLTLFMAQLVQIIRLRFSASVKWQDNYILIHTNGQWPTFSFFRWLFFDNTTTLSEAERKQVLEHEKVHIQQFHSLDVLFIEMVKILFWINPAIWLLRASIEEVHEFIADKNILRHTNESHYSSLLAKMALKQMTLSVGLHFNKSMVLKRIKMMKTPAKKFPVLKVASMSLLATLMVIVLSCNDQVMNEMMETSTQMDIPAELEDKLAEAKKKYPYADFIYMETDKSNQNQLEIYKDIDPESIAFMYVWPEKQRIGLLVNKNGPLKDQEHLVKDGDVYQIVDEPSKPVEGYETYYQKVADNITYTEKALKNNVEGTVYIMFIINEDGSMSDAQIIRGIGYGLDEVALEAVTNAGSWTPPMQEGKAVKQRIVLPVKFQQNQGSINSNIKIKDQ